MKEGDRCRSNGDSQYTGSQRAPQSTSYGGRGSMANQSRVPENAGYQTASHGTQPASYQTLPSHQGPPHRQIQRGTNSANVYSQHGGGYGKASQQAEPQIVAEHWQKPMPSSVHESAALYPGPRQTSQANGWAFPCCLCASSQTLTQVCKLVASMRAGLTARFENLSFSC